MSDQNAVPNNQEVINTMVTESTNRNSQLLPPSHDEVLKNRKTEFLK